AGRHVESKHDECQGNHEPTDDADLQACHAPVPDPEYKSEHEPAQECSGQCMEQADSVGTGNFPDLVEADSSAVSSEVAAVCQVPSQCAEPFLDIVAGVVAEFCGVVGACDRGGDLPGKQSIADSVGSGAVEQSECGLRDLVQDSGGQAEHPR